MSIKREYQTPIPWKRIIGSVVTLVSLVSLLIMDDLYFPLKVGIYAIGALLGGWYFYKESIEHIFEKKKVTIDVIMTLAIVGTAVLGELTESLTIVFLYSLTEALESYSVKRVRTAINSLIDLVPRTATIVESDGERVVPVEELVAADRIKVRPGDYIPTDGVVYRGNGFTNEAALTGESTLVTKRVGEKVFAGTICENGLLEVEVLKPVSESTVAKIIALVEDAQKRKVHTQLLVEKFNRYYNPFVLLMALTFFIVPVIFGGNISHWMTFAITLLVASAPCALAISTPVSIYAGVGSAGKKGILVKGGAYLQTLSQVDAIAFDKTGTLTLGTPKVSKIRTAKLSENDALQIIYSLEHSSTHPLSKAISNYVESKSVEKVEVMNFDNVSGYGIKGEISGTTWFFGKLHEEHLKEYKNTDLIEDDSVNKTSSYLVRMDNKSIEAVLYFDDEIRPEAKEAIQQLNSQNVRTFILTGDKEAVALKIASELGIPESDVYYNLSPQDKVDRIDQLRDEYTLAMVGDGINDAPALALADIGIAMGTAGTDVALETADVTIMGDNLKSISAGMKIGKDMVQIIKENLIASIIILFFLILGVLAGTVSLIVAILVHEGSETIIVANSLRIIAKNRKTSLA